MQIIDISRELFSTPAYPGDPAPYREAIRRMELGDGYNLTAFFSGCHSATHIDAPRHFLRDGKTLDQLPLAPFYGPCTVVPAEGLITGADIDRLAIPKGSRLLIKGEGRAFFTQSGAFALAQAGICLVGTDALSIAPPGDEAVPHEELLSAEIPILEGLYLSRVEPGAYFLCAFPLFLRGTEAAPARAVLLTG